MFFQFFLTNDLFPVLKGLKHFFSCSPTAYKDLWSTDACLESYQALTMELFCENS